MNKSISSVKALVACFLAISLTLSLNAYAALPTGVATFFTGITSDFTDLLNDYLYPLMFVVTGGLIIIGLIKKGAKKVT